MRVMINKYKRIWQLALPYLNSGLKKDFAIHTQGVIRATQLILKKEDADADLQILSAILHDVGWSKVPKQLQLSDNEDDKIKALKLHLEYARPIIVKILKQEGYKKDKINKIIEIILSHKFKNPKDRNKRILIDADNLSDAFKRQFASDAKYYKVSLSELYEFRKKQNKFYTKTAKDIFIKEINKRIIEK